MSEQKDRFAEVATLIWGDLQKQAREALDAGDWATMLKVEGGRAVLLHLSGRLGYEVSVKEGKKDGREGNEEPSQKSRRGKKKEKASGGE